MCLLSIGNLLINSCFSTNIRRQHSLNRHSLYLGDDGVMLPDPLVLRFLFDGVCGGELHSFAVAAQNGLAPAHVGSLQGEAAAVLAGSHRVVSDVT